MNLVVVLVEFVNVDLAELGACSNLRHCALENLWVGAPELLFFRSISASAAVIPLTAPDSREHCTTVQMIIPRFIHV